MPANSARVSSSAWRRGWPSGARRFPKTAAGPRFPWGPRLDRVRTISRVLSRRPEGVRRWRPFLWPRRCRRDPGLAARAVYPSPSDRTGRPPLSGRPRGRALGEGGRRLRDLARGGVCRAPAVASRAVRSYRTFSPLPEPLRAIGGFFSVALSLTRDRGCSRAGGRYPPPCPDVLGLSSGVDPERTIQPAAACPHRDVGQV